LLIGAQGRTLQALNTIIRQIINNEISVYPNIYLDVENYKDKQQARLERLAKNLAREVVKTKIEVK
jgi:predicted RNA-binding protein Jag